MKASATGASAVGKLPEPSCETLALIAATTCARSSQFWLSAKAVAFDMLPLPKYFACKKRPAVKRLCVLLISSPDELDDPKIRRHRRPVAHREEHREEPFAKSR